MRAGRLLAVTLLAAGLTAGCGSGPAPTDPTPTSSAGGTDVFTNPVYDKDTADPFGVRVRDTWYVFHTNAQGKNVPLLTSPDLVTWTEAGDAMPKLASWVEPGRNWAPEIIALSDDRYLLYYTALGRKSGRQCVGRAVAGKPTGPYVDDSDKPLVCQADLGGAIDASPFRDTDGSLWLLWKNDGNAVGQDTWLWSQRLSDDGLKRLGEPTRLLKQTEPWEGKLIEGPFMWRHDGRLFLFYAANNYGDDTYAEGYAVCGSPSGPCVKATENPILKSNAVASGPGHASMVEKDGRTWLLYHAWPPGSEGAVEPGRQLWLDEVVWTDGRPSVKGPTGNPQPRP